MGRHAKPSTHSSTGPMVAVAIATSGAFATVPLTQGVAQAATTAPSVDWAPIIHCESGGNPTSTNPRSTASGAFQFLDSTWSALGGRVFGRRAKDASFGQQTQIADRAFAQSGLGPWAASKHCWGGKVKGNGGHGKTKAHSQDDRGGHAQAPGHKKHHGRHAQSKPDASPTPDVTPAPDSAPTNATYVVRGGDSLSSIALAHHHTWQELFAANKAMIANPNMIRPGITINLSDPPDAGTTERPGTKKSDDAKAAAPLAGEKLATFSITGFGKKDNTPRGSTTISMPVIHQQAGGTGTFADPLTAATPGHAGSTETPKGTKFYVPGIQRYVIVEDSGASKFGQPHLDIWSGTTDNVEDCESKITKTEQVITNPGPNHPVKAGPIATGSGCNI